MPADRFVDLEESRPLTAVPRSDPQQPGRGTATFKVHGLAPGTGLIFASARTSADPPLDYPSPSHSHPPRVDAGESEAPRSMGDRAVPLGKLHHVQDRQRGLRRRIATWVTGLLFVLFVFAFILRARLALPSSTIPSSATSDGDSANDVSPVGDSAQDRPPFRPLEGPDGPSITLPLDGDGDETSSADNDDDDTANQESDNPKTSDNREANPKKDDVYPVDPAAEAAKIPVHEPETSSDHDAKHDAAHDVVANHQHKVASAAEEAAAKERQKTYKLPHGGLVYSARIVASYPHDKSAFTQGLEFSRVCSDKDGSTGCMETFLESTGMYGHSEVRRVHKDTGVVMSRASIGDKRFGEGLATIGDGRAYQLLWKQSQILSWDLGPHPKSEPSDQELIQTPLNDGWGLTYDGKGHLIATDSSDKLYFLDVKAREDYAKERGGDGSRLKSPNLPSLKLDEQWGQGGYVTVHYKSYSIVQVNELEYIEDEVWGNLWHSDCVARIDPATGQVNSWIWMHEIHETMKKENPYARTDVLNGIAFDAETGRIWVTGKYWPALYEIELVQETQVTEDDPQILQKCRPASVTWPPYVA